MADADKNNGKVTMAIIGQKLDSVITVVEEIRRVQAADHDKLLLFCEHVAQQEKDLLRLREELEQVNKDRKLESRMIGIIVGLLSAVGIGVDRLIK